MSDARVSTLPSDGDNMPDYIAMCPRRNVTAPCCHRAGQRSGRELLDQFGGGSGALEELADMGLRTPARLQRGNPHE